MGESYASTSGSVESKPCQISDDDLLVSVLLKMETSISNTGCFTQNSNHVRKRISQIGGSRLQVGNKTRDLTQSWNINRSTIGPRTVLSWLINTGAICKNEVIQLQSPYDVVVLKEGLVTKDGIICICCNKMLSISEFESHVGAKMKRPLLNLVMELGKPFALCQLEAWSTEYQVRKAPILTSEVNDSDDLCGVCGAAGKLVLCDNCPASFHQECLLEPLPEGKWYCLLCRCLACWDVHKYKDHSHSPGTLKCSLCKHKYHETCHKGKDANIGLTVNNWFCGQSCHEKMASRG